MTLARRFLGNRLSLLVALLALLTAALTGPQPAAQATCPDAGSVYYYSDATYTVHVGTCSHACCRTWTCTGELTQYSIAHMVVCDFT